MHVKQFVVHIFSTVQLRSYPLHPALFTKKETAIIELECFCRSTIGNGTVDQVSVHRIAKICV